MENEIHIEVCYAAVKRQKLLSLMVPVGTTIQQAIIISNIINLFPNEIDLSKNKIGIHGKVVHSLQQICCDGDRIEIYRPLICEPMEQRRQRINNTKNADSK